MLQKKSTNELKTHGFPVYINNKFLDHQIHQKEFICTINYINIYRLIS